ncbi:MAG: hypothetical protein SGARI_001129 [Bacillariaceae sp.]
MITRAFNAAAAAVVAATCAPPANGIHVEYGFSSYSWKTPLPLRAVFDGPFQRIVPGEGESDLDQEVIRLTRDPHSAATQRPCPVAIDSRSGVMVISWTSGTAFVYARNETSGEWTKQDKIVLPIEPTVKCVVPAVAEGGNRIAFGVYWRTKTRANVVAGSDCYGSVHLYHRETRNDAWNKELELAPLADNANNPTGDYYFGVKLFFENDRLVVSSNQNAYIYHYLANDINENVKEWTLRETFQDTRVALHGDRMLVGGLQTAATVFQYDKKYKLWQKEADLDTRDGGKIVALALGEEVAVLEEKNFYTTHYIYTLTNYTHKATNHTHTATNYMYTANSKRKVPPILVALLAIAILASWRQRRRDARAVSVKSSGYSPIPLKQIELSQESVGKF